MSRLALVAGHSVMGTEFGRDARRVDVPTELGTVAALDAGTHVLLQRHGLDRTVTAPYVDYRANLLALQELGCDRVLGIASVGSLKVELGVGTFVAPDDFIALHLGVAYTDAPSEQPDPRVRPRLAADRARHVGRVQRCRRRRRRRVLAGERSPLRDAGRDPAHGRRTPRSSG